ncbi:MAG: RNA polymerase sigma factor [Oscillospiraceae bacterium]|nr:RNA polymerase sigma factor [Oscillospiraceae bacterium]MDD4367345.1 RNA polymerase sigma factor [Oscillospiraceae bacterium]
MDRAEQGFDPRDYDYLVAAYGPMIYRLAQSRLRHLQDAEDVCQQVWLAYVRHAAKLKSEEHVKAWLIRATLHRCYSAGSSAYTRHHAELSEALQHRLASDHPEAFYSGESELRQQLNQLPAKYRDCLYLYYYEELSVAEIARALRRKEGTIKSCLHRGRRLLQQALKQSAANGEAKK